MGLFKFLSGTGIYLVFIYICIFVPITTAQTCPGDECYYDPVYPVNEGFTCTIDPVDGTPPDCYGEWTSITECHCIDPYARLTNYRTFFCSGGSWGAEVGDMTCEDPCTHDVDTTVVIVHMGGDCTSGEVINGSLPVMDGDTVCYECPLDYTNTGESVTSCVDGVWDASTTFTCTGLPCESEPPTGDDMIILEPITASYISGTVVVYSCPDGYQLDGSDSAICNHGNWTLGDVPSCSLIPTGMTTIGQDPTTEGVWTSQPTTMLTTTDITTEITDTTAIPKGTTASESESTTADSWTTELTSETGTIFTDMTTDVTDMTGTTRPEAESTTGGPRTTESTDETGTDVTATYVTDTTDNSTEFATNETEFTTDDPSTSQPTNETMPTAADNTTDIPTGTTTPEAEPTTGGLWTNESNNETVTTSTDVTATYVTDTTDNSTEFATNETEFTTEDPWTSQPNNETTPTAADNTTDISIEITTPGTELTTEDLWTTQPTNETDPTATDNTTGTEPGPTTAGPSTDKSTGETGTIQTATDLPTTEATNTTDNTTYATTSTTAPEETCAAPETGDIPQISPSQSIYGEGTAVEYSCPGEYRLTGPNSAMCTSGEWVPPAVPTCELVCLPPVPYDEFLEINPFRSSYNENDTIEYSCPRGYLIDLETSEASCNSSGEWDPSDVPSCKAIPCEAQETWADGSYAPVKDSYSDGTDVTFTCPEDEIPIGPTEAVCELGEWSTDAPTCVPEANGKTVEVTYCEAPPSFGGLVLTPSQDYYEIAAEVTFRCADRAKVLNTDDNIASCQDGGEWSNYPTSCVACGRGSDIGQCAGKPDHVCNHNTGGCVCPPGKAFHNENCVETDTVSTQARLDADFRKELEDKTSDAFKELEEDLCKSFGTTLDTRNTNVKRGFIKCFVRSFTNGSTIADMVTEYDQREKVEPEDVDEVILAQLQEQDSNGTGYTLPGLGVSFTQENPVASRETDVTISDCDDGTDVCHPIYGQCKYTDGMTSYTCTCADDSEDQYDEYDIGVSGVSCRSKPPNYALLIGLCVGVPLALILIVMVVMVICLKTSAKKGAGGIEGDDTDQGDNHGKPEDFAGTMVNGLADEGYDEGEVEKLEAMAAAISNMGTEPAMPLPRASQTETSFMAPNGHAAPPHGAHVNYGYNPTSPRTSVVLEGATPNSYEMNNRQPTQTQQHWVYRGSVAEA